MDQMHQSSNHSKINEKPGWQFILPSLVLVFLIGVPLIALVWRTINSEILTQVLSNGALQALKLSLFTSTISVAITLLTGTPLAYMQAHWKFKGKALIDALIDLPIVLPPSVAGIALLMAFGRQGLLGDWLSSIGVTLPFTTTAVVMAQVFVSAPFLVRSARVGFSAIDSQLEEAAKVEGASSWHVFQHIMLPLANRALLTGIILTWARALGEFGATLLFAGNLEGTTQTMPLAIYIGFEQGLGTALVLSVMLMVVSFVLLTVLRRLEIQSQH